MLPIHWTQHAIQRVHERFGFDKRIIIPNRVISKVGLDTPISQNFIVRRGRVVYVCQRVEAAVKVVTVYERGAVSLANTQAGAMARWANG